jgi:hypothetical protein
VTGRIGFTPLPSALALAGAGVFLLVCAWLYWPSPELAFRTDDSPAAWLSSAELWTLALLSLRTLADRTLPRWLAAWLALALMEMAFDEQFMLHEHWKYGCAAWWDACRYAWARELPMQLVAALGCGTGIVLYRAVPRGPARGLLVGALAVGLGALALRAGAPPQGLLPYKAALLVAAEGLFASVLMGLHQVHSP